MKLHLLGLGFLCTLPLATASLAVPDEDDDVPVSRELAGIAEEQALLRRQLQRLRSTMEVLLDRIETEGRTHTADLLREGLGLLDERAAASGATPVTLDELMELSRESVERGQLVQSLERQETLIGDLERLLSILMDRKNLESLEEHLNENLELQETLGELLGREQDLRRETESLRQSASSEGQRALEETLQSLMEEQTRQLSENEELGRESGTMELELLERELNELVRDQTTDSEVLDAWQPAESEELRSALAKLEEARSGEARAGRLSEAADSLREAAEEIESATPAEASEGNWAESLAAAAEGEERHARVSGDPAAQEAAEALQAGSEAVAEADLGSTSPEPREATAAELRELAEGLDAAAEAARAPAREARAEAERQVGELAERETAAGQMAREAQEPLSQVAEREAAGEEEGARRALEQAAQALRQGQESLEFLGQALARSQAEGSERSERIARGLDTLSPGQSPSGQQAREQLSEAASKMQEAAQAARQDDAAQAGESAREALEALKEAAQALAQARENAGQEVAQSARQGAQAQSELAQQTRSAQPQVAEGSLNPVAEESVRQDLERAAEAMERAAQELSEGKSASAAASQREAREALSRASESAREGVSPDSPEDRQRAEELAREQEQIRQDILDLARRAEERKNAQPLPSLERADQAAQQAGESLEQGDLSEAERNEEEVERELENALDELKEEEEAYQRLRQEEILFRIAEEVLQMISAHREQMTAVREIDAGRTPGETPSRSQRLRLRAVAREEESLAARANEMAEAIASEQSQVTAELMNNVADDLTRIARDLGQEGDYDTGERVQARQRDVEENLEWLLEALKQEQRRREQEQQQQQQQQQEGQNQQQPLVPDATELKLLRRMELDVQNAVDEMLILYPELEDPDSVDPLVLEEILRLASRHERVTVLFSGLRERVGLPPPDGEQAPAEDEDQEDR
ncbi:MAG: hypothetical protein AAF682_19325 [Planctomycetota bacterium]